MTRFSELKLYISFKVLIIHCLVHVLSSQIPTVQLIHITNCVAHPVLRPALVSHFPSSAHCRARGDASAMMDWCWMEIAVFPPLVAAATMIDATDSLESSSGMVKNASSCVSVMESLEMSIAHLRLAVNRKSAVLWRGSMAAILVPMVPVMLQETPITNLLMEAILTFKADADMCCPKYVMILVACRTSRWM